MSVSLNTNEKMVSKPVWAGLDYATLQQCMHCGLFIDRVMKLS